MESITAAVVGRGRGWCIITGSAACVQRVDLILLVAHAVSDQSTDQATGDGALGLVNTFDVVTGNRAKSGTDGGTTDGATGLVAHARATHQRCGEEGDED